MFSSFTSKEYPVAGLPHDPDVGGER